MSLIDPQNHLAIFTVLFVVTAIGIIGEHRKWLRYIAGTLFVIAFMALLSNLGIVPSAADPDLSVPAYTLVFNYFVPLAIPLLLFGANLNSLLSTSKKLIFIFFIGTLGILLGASLSFLLFDLGDNTYKVVGVFAATLIGGSVNFLATAESLGFTSDPLFATAAAVDNLFANAYIFLLFLLPNIQSLRSKFKDPEVHRLESSEVIVDDTSTTIEIIEKVAVALGVAFLVFWLGELIGAELQAILGTKINLDILVSTVIILALANIKIFGLSKYEDVAFSIGMVLLFVFLGVIGTAVSIKVVTEAGPSVIYICLTTILIHILFTMLVARISGVSLEAVAITSAANTAGPSISAPLAATIGQKHLVSSAILLGIVGYAIGTFLGVGLATFLNAVFG